MAARDTESALLARCSLAARELAQSARDQREANVFRLAAMVVRSRFPGESVCLLQASERYFASHPSERLAAAEVVRKGWVVSLPRLRDMLSHRLHGLAGGMAVHLYTGNRVTTDVDAEFGGRVHLPNDLMVEVTLEDGTQQVVYFDTNYNSSFALMHEDYLDDSVPVDLGSARIRVHVLSPVDLAVSKIARFADNDKEDIAALVRLGLTTADEIEQRASTALAGYVGGQGMLALNLRDAVALARHAEELAADPRAQDARARSEKRGES